MSQGRCYFGCMGVRLSHILLDLPGRIAPKLCEDHAPSWRLYRASKITQTDTLSWPDDFWPWAKRIEEEMQEEAKNAPTQETRAPGTEIQASEAVVGYWYTVPSGEVERCFAIRNRGRGVQAGFVGVAETGTDPDDVRWLRGQAAILVADELEAVKWMQTAREANKRPCSDLSTQLCPRTGASCSVCGAPQRSTPSGDSCDNGHGGAPGVWKFIECRSEQHVNLSQVDDLGKAPPDPIADKAATEAEIASATGALDEGRTAGLELAEDTGRRSTEGASAALEALAARTADRLVIPRQTPVYHKSLHIDWRTPKALFDAQVARWGPYWLDAAATQENKLCEYYLGPETDSLSVDWEPDEEITAQHGFNIWLNHPYSKGEPKCLPDCNKPKCAERGYHLDKPVAPSGDWMVYARNQALGSALKFGGVLTCLTKASVETQWWKESVRIQPPGAGEFLGGSADPYGGPARGFMETTRYKAATWTEFRWTNLVVDIVEIEGRVDFDRGGDDGNAGFPSALVTYYRPG